MKNHEVTLKNHETILKTMKNHEATLKNHETTLKTMKLPFKGLSGAIQEYGDDFV